VNSGSTPIGYLIESEGAVAALDAAGSTLGMFPDRRTAFRAVSSHHIMQVRP
jgi:hypothetical protein